MNKKNNIDENKNGATTFISKIASILASLSLGASSVTEIAKQCKLGTSTTHRLLTIMKDPGLTIYDPVSHRYYLGPLINQLASRGNSSHQFLVKAILPELEHLAEISQETIDLRLLLGFHIVSLYENLSNQKLVVRISYDKYAERHSFIPLASSHIVLLAQLDEIKLKNTLEKIKLIYDPLFDMERLQRQIKSVKEDGYFISHGARTAGIVGISVPVNNYIFPVSLTVIGPEIRMIEKMAYIKKELLDIVKIINEKTKKLTNTL
jgi:DNA-binding IclR family transcriptional regulator